MPPRRILRLGLFDNILRVPIRPDALGQQSSSFAVKNHRKLHRRAETRPPAHPKHSSTQLRLYRHSPQARSAVETPDMGKKEDKAKAQSLKTPKYVAGGAFGPEPPGRNASPGTERQTARTAACGASGGRWHG